MASWGVIAGGAGVVVCGLAIAGWQFLRDNLDEKRGKVGDKAHSEWIMKVCGGDKFANSLFKVGFLKSSVGWFIRDAKRILTGATVAADGSRWIDAELVDSAGKPTRLFSLRPSAPGRPLILNFGSWT